MVFSREEKEKRVLELYYDKGYRYRDIAKELRMSPNQISEIIKRHEEKNEASANKKKVLSLSSQAYKLFSDGKTNVEVAIRLDIPQAQVTQFRSEYWRLRDQDNLERLYTVTKGNVSQLWELYNELVLKRGMSYEKVANLVDIALNKLPYMENLFEQAKWAADKQQERFDSLGNRIRSLDDVEKRRKRMITLHPSSYYYLNDR
jgi:transposase